MKHCYLFINLILIFFIAIVQGQETSIQNNHKKLLNNINGEWVVKDNWANDVLTFKKNKREKVNHFYAYNTIIFNQKNQKIKVNTYGEFGCGTAATQNLKMYETEWKFKNNQLYIKGNYSDYSGKHLIENIYFVERKEHTLTLIKTDLK